METQRLGRYVAENLYEMVYERLLDSYCTPEIRYQRLMKRCPDLKDTVPLKSIASFLGVTPETVSRIRRKLRNSQLLTFIIKGLDNCQDLFFFILPYFAIFKKSMFNYQITAK